MLRRSHFSYQSRKRNTTAAPHLDDEEHAIAGRTSDKSVLARLAAWKLVVHRLNRCNLLVPMIAPTKSRSIVIQLPGHSDPNPATALLCALDFTLPLLATQATLRPPPESSSSAAGGLVGMETAECHG